MPGARVGRRGRGQATIMSRPRDHYGSGVIVQYVGEVALAAWGETREGGIVQPQRQMYSVYLREGAE